MAIADPMSTDPFGPYRMTMGRTELMSPTRTTDDLRATDWNPCDQSGQPPAEDRRDVLRLGGTGRKSLAICSARSMHSTGGWPHLGR